MSISGISINTGIRGTDSWLTRFTPNARARMRLFCFPYAGGGAYIFRDWANHLPVTIEVCPMQPPGRGNRLDEEPFTDLDSLTQSVAIALAPYLDKPFAFFGHSMGGMVSFELAHKLRREYGVEPAHLFVSGCRAPQTPYSNPITFDLSEQELIGELRRLKGTPSELLEHPEWVKLMIPTLRADFKICQTYTYSAKPPLSCSITAFGGLHDEDVRQEHLTAWRAHTIASLSLQMLAGDHFFLHTSESTLLQLLSRQLNRLVSISDSR
jgi:medium-chain acyl-[acyl-carrier-protein] hydrolase